MKFKTISFLHHQQESTWEEMELQDLYTESYRMAVKRN
jgi:hypothetical protein